MFSFSSDTKKIRIMNLVKKCAVIMVCFFTAFVGVSFSAEAQSDLYNRLQRAERDIQTLSKAVYKGESLPEGMVSGIDDGEKHRAQVDVRLNDLETQIRTLRGQVEQYQYALDTLTSKVQMLETRASAPATPVISQAPVSPAISQNNAVTTLDAPVLTQVQTPVSEQAVVQPNNVNNLAASHDPTGDYERAFSLLKSGDNSGAQKAFSTFIERYPEDNLAGNARYWLGEAYYVQNFYDKAARTFADAYQKSPQGSKAPDNLLKLGLSLAGLGRKEDACVSLSQLDKEFGSTGSAIVRRGEQEATSLGC